MKRKILSIILIVLGLMIIAYPTIRDIYTNHQQEKLITKWQEDLTIIDSGDIDDLSSGEDNDDLGLEENGNSDMLDMDGIDGILSIKKIDLTLPILQGATKKNLSVSVASLEDTGEPGGYGNYALAAHRSRAYGKNFNRLEELEMGDEVEVNTGEANYRYTVTDKLLVLPEETWVLSGTKEEKEITLITCHPMKNPTHRLIIKGAINE